MKKTLLLADDSPTIQKVINLTFADEGIDVIAVSDGNAALQQLREMKPDLVMADVHMPGLNGYQICERLRQNTELRSVPVILLVGSFEPFDEEEAKRVGADDFLMKPFQSIRQLVSRVTALLEPPAAEEAQEEEVRPQVEEEAKTFIADIHDTSGTFEQPQETSAAAEIATSTETEPVPFQQTAVETEDDDELTAFDLEFDQKFPDAAALSSDNIDAVSFNYTPSPYIPESTAVENEPFTEDLSGGVEKSAPFEASASIAPSFQEAAPVETSDYAAPGFHEAPPADEPQAFSLDTDPDIFVAFPDDTGSEEMAAQPEPERIVDEDSEDGKVIEHGFASLVGNETAPVLEIEDTAPVERPFASGFILDIESEPQAAAETRAEMIEESFGEAVAEAPPESAETFAEPVAESFAVPSFVDTPSGPPVETVEEKAIEPFAEPFRPQYSETSQYDFRNADAFDEDLDIREIYHGVGTAELKEMPPVIQEAEPSPVAETQITEAALAEGPLERIVDEDEDPGRASVDQADGFSGAIPQPVPAVPAAPEAVDAVAQRVFEQLSEKVVTELVRGIMPEIKDLIAREIAKDRE